MVTVGLDGGHGGPDHGALANGIFEEPLNLDLAERFAEGILALGAGRVVMLRTREDVGKLELHERGTRARLASCDLVLSIHANTNADPAVPGATFYYWPGDGVAHEVAETLHRCWPDPLRRPTVGRFRQAVYEATDNPEERDDWLRRARAVLGPHRPTPAVVIECGFLTNHADALALQDELVRRAMVPAVVAGVLRFEQLRRRA
jgi:N-acetylmuramoyl-L-alanine amidase